MLRERARVIADAVVVVAGAALLLLTALNQPYNQNEWAQIQPYGSPDLGEAVSGTRQPPLGPLLGVLVQRVLGEGHLEQRVVPVASGIGTLVLMSLLLRRLRLGWAGTLALVFLATAPLFVRFSAYTRPYALPVFLMLLCAFAGSRWLDSGRRGWLALATGAGLLLPVARVPEPVAFLATAAVVLVILGARRSVARARAWTLAGALALALATAGVAMAVRLLAQGSTTTGRSLVDPAPDRVLARLPAATARIRDEVLPLLADWLPWWPLTLAVVLLGLLLPSSARRLLGTWYWLPLALAPVAFLVGFHAFIPLDLRDYKVRFAYFLVPPLAILVGLACHAVFRSLVTRRVPGTVAVPVAATVVAALVVAQLPATWRVLTENDALDLAAAGQVLAAEVPADAVVVFDGPARVGRWRQSFFGDERFLSEETTVVNLLDLARGRLRPAVRGGEVYLLLMDAACVSTVGCDGPPVAAWDGDVAGYEVVRRLDHLTLHAPTEGQRGAPGLLRAMRALVAAYGAEHAVPNAVVAARLLRRDGREAAAGALLRSVCAAQPPAAALKCRRHVRYRGLGELLQPARG